MERIAFTAWDYTADDRFTRAEYVFEGSKDKGWSVSRNGALHLVLGPGYLPLAVEYCGICGTDLSRRFLPFPLPQVIGHEVSAVDPSAGERVTVEINDSCTARGDASPEAFCRAGLPTHCPERRVLGIDRLPGGFGPWILAPVNALVSAPGIGPRAATLVEPLAAALHALRASPPRENDRVAVLGTGRLGLLIAACLLHQPGYRGPVTVLGIDPAGLERARKLGAPVTLDMRSENPERCDIVYDASGDPEGFVKALSLARREVHLKSTHGRECLGVAHLTEMVVDEISLVPFSEESLAFTWPEESRANARFYAAPGTPRIGPSPGREIFEGDTRTALARIEALPDALPRCDCAVVQDAASLDAVLRPDPAREMSLVRPRGAVLVAGKDHGHPLLDFVASGGSVRTSRCGSHREALRLLAGNPGLAALLEETLVTAEFSGQELPAAFKAAKAKGSCKVLVRHS